MSFAVTTDPVSADKRSDSRRPTALAVAAIALCLASAFVAVRVSAVGWDGFVAAGSVTATDASVFTYDHYGYDGQFFYRLALEPFSTAERVDGIAFDAPAYRQQRIGYPLAAFAVAALTPLSTVVSLVAVNVAALGVMVFFAARIAQHFGRSPAFGLLLLAWPAFIFSLGLDLSEIVAAALVLGVLRFALLDRHLVAAVFATGAVITRESAVLVAIAAILVYRRWIYAWAVGVLAVWEVTIWFMWNEIPGVTSRPAPGERMVGLPFLGLIEGIQRWWVLDLAVFASLVVLLWIGSRHYRHRSLEGTGFLLYLALVVCLGWPVWESWRGFARASVELVLMIFVLRMNDPRRSLGAESATPAVNGDGREVGTEP